MTIAGDNRTLGRLPATHWSVVLAAVKMAMMRLRRRFRAAIRKEAELTVDDPKDVDDEVRYLISVLRA